MQKKLIAVAVAGLMSGAAFADANVTISGVADVYYGRLKGDSFKAYNAINDGGLSGSRIKFAGAEDLGNGLKAIFESELAYNQADNGGLSSTRQSYVGLAGSFGAIVAGRLQTPGYYVGKFDALASAAISPQGILSGQGKMIGGAVNSTIAPNSQARLNSAVAYLSPNFGGFSAVVAASTSNHSTSEQATLTDSNADEGAYALGLNYAIGPVAIGFVHHNIQNYGGGVDTDVKENMLGAKVDLGFMSILGSYQNSKLKNTDTNKLYQFGVVVPVGAGNIHAAVGKLDMKAENKDATSYTVAYTHGLSKRTTAYAGYNATSNKDAQAIGITTTEAGGKASGLVVGVRHTF